MEDIQIVASFTREYRPRACHSQHPCPFHGVLNIELLFINYLGLSCLGFLLGFLVGSFLDTNQDKPPLAGLLFEAAMHLLHICAHICPRASSRSNKSPHLPSPAKGDKP
ncbi:MAG: hypothetical protein MJZ62_03525 [Bacteroidales bacterium]|nr:hypothetical protein [Bacteroidales bacterium]